MAESPRIDGLGLEELKSLFVQVLEDNARLKAENVELRDERHAGRHRADGKDRSQQAPARRQALQADHRRDHDHQVRERAGRRPQQGLPGYHRRG